MRCSCWIKQKTKGCVIANRSRTGIAVVECTARLIFVIFFVNLQNGVRKQHTTPKLARRACLI